MLVLRSLIDDHHRHGQSPNLRSHSRKMPRVATNPFGRHSINMMFDEDCRCINTGFDALEPYRRPDDAEFWEQVQTAISYGTRGLRL